MLASEPAPADLVAGDPARPLEASEKSVLIRALPDWKPTPAQLEWFGKRLDGCLGKLAGRSLYVVGEPQSDFLFLFHFYSNLAEYHSELDPAHRRAALDRLLGEPNPASLRRWKSEALFWIDPGRSACQLAQADPERHQQLLETASDAGPAAEFAIDILGSDYDEGRNLALARRIVPRLLEKAPDQESILYQRLREVLLKHSYHEREEKKPPLQVAWPQTRELIAVGLTGQAYLQHGRPWWEHSQSGTPDWGYHVSMQAALAADSCLDALRQELSEHLATAPLDQLPLEAYASFVVLARRCRWEGSDRGGEREARVLRAILGDQLCRFKSSAYPAVDQIVDELRDQRYKGAVDELGKPGLSAQQRMDLLLESLQLVSSSGYLDQQLFGDVSRDKVAKAWLSGLRADGSAPPWKEPREILEAVPFLARVSPDREVHESWEWYSRLAVLLGPEKAKESYLRVEKLRSEGLSPGKAFERAVGELITPDTVGTIRKEEDFVQVGAVRLPRRRKP